MEPYIGILSAVIAAIVSLFIALISALANRRAIQAERERLEIQLQRDMTARLYDVRLEVYPKAIEITEGLRKSRVAEQGEDISENYFKSILKQLDDWNSTKAGFILSQNSLYKLYDLRRALREEPEANGKYSREQMTRIWQAKGAFRAALRADIQLLYKEEQVEEVRDD
jgi:Rad3-related DNA helicase